ncbi:MAG: tRNA 5-methoxyuridine(34)/uridine 5-oxyacetic acid(34) synthase CmoB [Pseudomonadales bacterium]|nr:tRNA 5-methoxyuridine(34)/uridine 5-oxyacetic acid(34) synthase CmoB [Pseudomonadales bacterium]
MNSSTSPDLLGYQHFLHLLQGMEPHRDKPRPDSRLETLAALLSPAYLHSLGHGKLPFWEQLLSDVPTAKPSRLEFQSAVQIGTAADLQDTQSSVLEHCLEQLIPWRKGPFSLFGIELDTEWRSDWKWDRLLPCISPLAGRTVLDVGCGNGYHCWRMFGEKAKLVLGIEPHLPYVMQFALIRKLVPDLPVFLLPATLSALPAKRPLFDTVFSMGVLYHQRSPVEHLLELKSCLHEGGELVLETLVVDGPEGYSLMPKTRYCRMSNVWFLPSCATVQVWLQRCGFKNIRLHDVSVTTIKEQRATRWMPFQSLLDGLAPGADKLTIEGLPAPKRALFTASR